MRFSTKTRLPLLLAVGVILPALAQAQAPEEVRISVGKSVTIDYPTDIARVSTSVPEVADAVVISTRELALHAKGLGVSTVIIWAKTGQRTFYNVTVQMDMEPIRRILKETFPIENIQIQSMRDSVSLVGRVSSQQVADRAGALVASFAKTVVNNLQVDPGVMEKQIMLRVKFVELNRSASQDFGVNLMSTGALNTPGIITTGKFGPPANNQVGGVIPGGLPGTTTNFTLSDALNIFFFRPDLNLASTIRALQSRGLLQILAEPNLVTANGKEASFLVGGEFPVPVLQGGSNAGAVTIQFREYGIRLLFTPQLTTHNTLKMYVKPEVSTIDLANGISFSGTTIPALATRRMETNLELSPGQSFVIGGLIDDRVTESMASIPGISKIPVLGALFKSRSENKSKSELIVMVTPEIVEPLNATDPKPMLVFPHEFMAPAEKAQPETTSRRGKPGSKDSEAGTEVAQTGDTQRLVVRLEDTIPAEPAPAAAPVSTKPETAATAAKPIGEDSQPAKAKTGGTGAAESQPEATAATASRTAESHPEATAATASSAPESKPEATAATASNAAESKPEATATTASDAVETNPEATVPPAASAADPATVQPAPAGPAPAAASAEGHQPPAKKDESTDKSR